jgi:hypothetical protein
MLSEAEAVRVMVERRATIPPLRGLVIAVTGFVVSVTTAFTL